MNVLLIGAPGSGKGTQGQRIADRLDIAHVAAGDLLRAEVAAGTPLGVAAQDRMRAGQLVPDELVIALLRPVLERAVAEGGFVLDGFPRTLPQAQEARALARREGFSADAVLYLQAPPQELTARLLARAREQGRADDTAEVIAERLRVFEQATAPLVGYYRERGLLTVIDALGEPDEVTERLLAALPARRR